MVDSRPFHATPGGGAFTFRKRLTLECDAKADGFSNAVERAEG